MDAREYAALWQQVAKKKVAASPTTEVEIDGFKFEGRRVQIQGWVKSGRLPQSLVTELIRAEQDGDIQGAASNVSPEQAQQLLKFQRDIVCAVVVKPKIVTHDDALAEGEVRYADISEAVPDLMDKIFAWAAGNSPSVPVATEGGEVTLAEVRNFPDDRRLPDSGVDVPELRAVAEPEAANT